MLVTLLTLLLSFSGTLLGQLEDSELEDDVDLADFGLDIVRLLKETCLSFWLSIFRLLMMFLSPGTAQGPSPGENYNNQGKTAVSVTEILRVYAFFFNVLFWRIGGGGWDEEQPRVDLNYNLNSLFQNDQI